MTPSEERWEKDVMNIHIKTLVSHCLQIKGRESWLTRWTDAGLLVWPWFVWFVPLAKIWTIRYAYLQLLSCRHHCHSDSIALPVWVGSLFRRLLWLLSFGHSSPLVLWVCWWRCSVFCCTGIMAVETVPQPQRWKTLEDASRAPAVKTGASPHCGPDHGSGWQRQPTEIGKLRSDPCPTFLSLSAGLPFPVTQAVAILASLSQARGRAFAQKYCFPR